MSADVFKSLAQAVAERAKRAEVFEAIDCAADGLRCQARDVEEEALYVLLPDTGDASVVWVGLHTPDRWLSESIEADLLHQGDKMEDLLDEELVELGFEAGPLPIEHFRDDDKVYVFRSSLKIINPGNQPSAEAIEQATKVLLAYEACFRQLGDMSPSDELV